MFLDFYDFLCSTDGLSESTSASSYKVTIGMFVGPYYLLSSTDQLFGDSV